MKTKIRPTTNLQPNPLAGHLRATICVIFASAMILPSSLFASVIITNSQVYVYGDAYAGISPNLATDAVGPSTVSATGNQTWTRAVSAARSGYFGNAAVNLASVIGLSQFSLATINSGVTLSRSGVA